MDNLSFGRLYGSWNHTEHDGDDPDANPDIAPVRGTVKVAPVGGNKSIRVPGIPRSTGLFVTADQFEFTDSTLKDNNGDDGVVLVSHVDGVPVAWTVTVTFRTKDGLPLHTETFTVTGDTWRTVDGERVANIPDLIPSSTPPAVSGSAVAAQQSAANAALSESQARGHAEDASQAATAALGYRDEAAVSASATAADRVSVEDVWSSLQVLLGDNEVLSGVQAALDNVKAEYLAAIEAAINDLRQGVDPTLDTLAELADALNNDPDFAATMATALAGKAPLVHSHTVDDIDGLATAITWDGLQGKPATFPATAHTHPWEQVTGKPGAYTPTPHRHGWGELDGVPTVFTPAAHTHAETDVEGLTAKLAAMQAQLDDMGGGGPAVQDTGWRDLAGELQIVSSGVYLSTSGGRFLFRRTGTEVEFKFRAPSYTWDSAISSSSSWTLPAGFWPSRSISIYAQKGDTTIVYLNIFNDGRFYASSPSMSNRVAFGSYETSDPWPETLPGVPWNP